jgi:hypothetical protein
MDVDSITRKLTMKLKNYGAFLIAPSSSVRDEIEIQRARLRLSLQLASVVLFIIPDALSLIVLGNALPIGMPLILAAHGI